MNAPPCPHCSEKYDIKIRDKGLKWILRALMGNNRYCCLSCNATWRGRFPSYWEMMRGRNRTHGTAAAG